MVYVLGNLGTTDSMLRFAEKKTKQNELYGKINYKDSPFYGPYRYTRPYKKERSNRAILVGKRV